MEILRAIFRGRVHLGVGGRHPVASRRRETERQVGPLECTSARKADSGTHGGSGAGNILKNLGLAVDPGAGCSFY